MEPLTVGITQFVADARVPHRGGIGHQIGDVEYTLHQTGQLPIPVERCTCNDRQGALHGVCRVVDGGAAFADGGGNKRRRRAQFEVQSDSRLIATPWIEVADDAVAINVGQAVNAFVPGEQECGELIEPVKPGQSW